MRLIVDARGARYPVTVDPIAQQAYVKASNTDAEDLFGRSVAVSGDTVVVGASKRTATLPGSTATRAITAQSSAGAAYVFVRSGANLDPASLSQSFQHRRR